MNIYLKYKPAGVQLAFFLSLSFAFLLISSYVTTLFFPEVGQVLLDKKAVITPELLGRFKWAQFINSILAFVMPALLFGYFSSERPARYVGLNPRVSLAIAAAAVLLLFAVQPFAGWLGELNSKVHFGSMQKELQEVEASYNRTMGAFLTMKSPADLAINICIMALVPAIGEELFFRGALQGILGRLIKIPWVAVLLSSLVFALLHGTFFKFLPIFTLGLMLGSVYQVTRNLWYTIIIHFFNNTLAVLAVYYGDKNRTLKQFANDQLSMPIYAVIVSLVLTLAIIYVIKRKSDTVLPVAEVEEDNYLPNE